MKKLVHLTRALCLLLTVLLISAQADDDFPLRAKYPDVQVISVEDLAKDFEQIIVVDVRSKMEFDVAHVNGAKHITLAKASFANDLEAVRSKTDSQPMAFYCNGHTCAKSYKAYKKASEAGFTNILAYDAGIFDWIKAQPQKATLMGATPASADKIIPKSELKKHFLGFNDFKAKAETAGTMVIDIREPFQREEKLEINGLRNIPLDRLLGLLKKKQFQDKHLMIFDAVGKQVRWLQYHLEENGYTDYTFLKNGVKGAM